MCGQSQTARKKVGGGEARRRGRDTAIMNASREARGQRGPGSTRDDFRTPAA